MKGWLPALLLAVAFILAACGGAGGGQQGSGSGGGMAGMDHSNMGHGSMGMGSGEMARQMVMENGKYSDERFIDAMVPHHQGAIAMAKVALKQAEHDEIEELKSIKKEEFGTSQVPMEMSQEQMRGMGMMMDPQQLANQKPFDEAFIDAMIPHHRSAIEMAQVALENSDNPKIKELAQNIINAQQREIEQMTQWRQQWYPEE